MQRKKTWVCVRVCVCVCVCVCIQLGLTLCNLMNCSPPGSSVHGIFQARILEWVAISSSRGIFPTQRLNRGILGLLHRQADSLPLAPPGKPLQKTVQHYFSLEIHYLFQSNFWNQYTYNCQLWYTAFSF